MVNDSELIRSIKTQNELLQRLKNLQIRLDKKAELIKKEKDEYTCDIEKITKKLKEDQRYLQNLLEGNIHSSGQIDTNKMMTIMEISFVEKYFERIQSDSQTLDMVDRILTGLKFFRRMEKKNRIDILLTSKLIIVEPQGYVIKQGDVGSHMYIIIKGWINVKAELRFRASTDLTRIKEPVYLRQLATLYDGDHFGEIALIDLEQKEDISVLSPPKKRNASWIAVEKTYLLEVPHISCIRAYQAAGAKHMKERLEFLK